MWRNAFSDSARCSTKKKDSGGVIFVRARLLSDATRSGEMIRQVLAHGDAAYPQDQNFCLSLSYQLLFTLSRHTHDRVRIITSRSISAIVTVILTVRVRAGSNK